MTTQPVQLPLPIPETEQRSTTPTVAGVHAQPTRYYVECWVPDTYKNPIAAIRVQLVEAAQRHDYPLFFELSALCARIGNKERK